MGIEGAKGDATEMEGDLEERGGDRIEGRAPDLALQADASALIRGRHERTNDDGGGVRLGAERA